MKTEEQEQVKLIALAMAYGACRKGDEWSRETAMIIAKREADYWVHEAYEFLITTGEKQWQDT